jgi:hypothetical protein
MSTSSTEAQLRGLYADYAEGRAKSVLAALHPAVHWTSIGDATLPWAGTYQGPEGVMQYLERLGGAIELRRFEVERIIAQGDWATVLCHATGRYRRTGAVQDHQLVHVLRLEDGQIIEFREFLDTAMARTALGQAPG